MHGFEGRNNQRDRILVDFGSLIYSANVPGGTSGSQRSATASTVQARMPWHDDVTGGGARFEAPNTGLWFHAQINSSTNNAFNDGHRVGVGRSGSWLWGISTEDNTLAPTINILGVVVATAGAFAMTSNTWHRFHLEIEGEAEGDTWRLYTSGDLTTPIASYVLSAGDAANLLAAGRPDEFWFGVASNTRFADDLWLMDPNDGIGETDINRLLAGGIRPQVFTGNAVAQDWTGDYTAIDELPANDADGINATLPNEISEFTKPALTGTAATVAAVKHTARVTRGDITAGVNIGLRSNDGVNLDEKVVAAPGDGDVTVMHQTAPDGSSWTPTSWDGADIGYRSVT